jgi:hypothetical protein
MTGLDGSNPRPPPQSSKATPGLIPQAVLPQPERAVFTDEPIMFCSLRNLDRCASSIHLSKPFQQTAAMDDPSIFVSKCRDCRFLCDFTSPYSDIKLKDIKTLLLKDIASSFTLPHLVSRLTPDCLTAFFDMLAVNLFRPFPHLPFSHLSEAYESNFRPYLSLRLCDFSWPHISLVYDCLVASLDCSGSVAHLTPKFLSQLMRNGASPDERERVAVCDVLYGLYGKLLSERVLLRGTIAHQFTNEVCSPELLTFVASFVRGFNSPLKPEHVSFYHRCVLPLHRLNCYSQFDMELTDLVVIYVTKSHILLEPTVTYLLQHWPQSRRDKQPLFLMELETLVGTFETHITSQMAIAVFKLVGKMIVSASDVVALTAVRILLNPSVASTIKRHAPSLYPLILEPTDTVARDHCQEIIRVNALVALHTLAEVDHATFGRVKGGFQAVEDPGVRSAHWGTVFDASRAADGTIRLPSLSDVL